MDRKGLFSIGEVSKLFHISVSSLRHYENVGLLHLEYISPDSGYCYYGTEQFEVLNTIRYLIFLILDDEDIYDGETMPMAESLCVRICFRGSHAEAPGQHKKLLGYIRKHQMQIVGFSREIQTK